MLRSSSGLMTHMIYRIPSKILSERWEVGDRHGMWTWKCRTPFPSAFEFKLLLHSFGNKILNQGWTCLTSTASSSHQTYNSARWSDLHWYHHWCGPWGFGCVWGGLVSWIPMIHGNPGDEFQECNCILFSPLNKSQTAPLCSNFWHTFSRFGPLEDEVKGSGYQMTSVFNQ